MPREIDPIDIHAAVRAFARMVAEELLKLQAPAPPAPYSSDPRALRLPPGWSKRQWDDAGRRAKGDPRRPPLRKDPRGYSCPADVFDAWAASANEKPRRAAPVKPETDEQRRARQLAAIGLRARKS
jgi:hypothetical protein